MPGLSTPPPTPKRAASGDEPELSLPAGVEQLLVDVVADGFALYCCGPKTVPTALLACYEWDECVDLLTVRDFGQVITARVPKQGRRVDIFAPKVVVWAYQGPPQHAVRSLLDLVHPGHPDAPIAVHRAPAGLHIPRAQQRPMTIQLPTPGRAGAREARLATAMRTHGADRGVCAATGQAAEDRRLAAGRASGPRRSVPGGQPVPNHPGCDVHHAR